MRFGGYLGAPKQQALASRQAPDFFGASKALGSLRTARTLPAVAIVGGKDLESFPHKVRNETRRPGDA